MKTIIAKNVSFCDGVQRAFSMASKFASKKHGYEIFILGSLAHNKSVEEKIGRLGIRKIKNLRSVKKGDRVIITAHGSSEKTFQKIRMKGAKVFDTTCPKVAKVQRIARHYYGKGYKIFIFGDFHHKEVKGINGWTKNSAIIFENLSQARYEAFKLPNGPEAKAILLSQTTQDIRQFQKVSSFFKRNYKNVLIFDTICRSTYLRQREAGQVSKNNKRMVVVIGGKDSGNTKRLWQVCKKNNPNTFWISVLDEPEKALLAKAAKKFSLAVIVSGASTPIWQIREIDKYLRNC